MVAIVPNPEREPSAGQSRQTGFAIGSPPATLVPQARWLAAYIDIRANKKTLTRPREG